MTVGEDVPEDTPVAEVHLEQPRPGHGTVWVNGSDDAQWFASWQDGDRIADSPMGSREDAVAWAQEVPADRRAVFDDETDSYVDLGPDQPPT
jgi:hypothetical protein